MENYILSRKKREKSTFVTKLTFKNRGQELKQFIQKYYNFITNFLCFSDFKDFVIVKLSTKQRVHLRDEHKNKDI